MFHFPTPLSSNAVPYKSYYSIVVLRDLSSLSTDFIKAHVRLAHVTQRLFSLTWQLEEGERQSARTKILYLVVGE